jgi:hypothetical protein
MLSGKKSLIHPSQRYVQPDFTRECRRRGEQPLMRCTSASLSLPWWVERNPVLITS